MSRDPPCRRAYSNCGRLPRRPPLPQPRRFSRNHAVTSITSLSTTQFSPRHRGHGRSPRPCVSSVNLRVLCVAVVNKLLGQNSRRRRISTIRGPDLSPEYNPYVLPITPAPPGTEISFAGYRKLGWLKMFEISAM